MEYESTLARVVQEVVAPAAAEIDRTGAFPRRQIDALAQAGLLALTIPVELGGGGLGLRAAADVVRALGAACGSTAMIATMHYSATAALIATERTGVLSEIAAGRHLSTLAFSETGSRSHFWAPVSTAIAEADEVRLDAHKSWVTAAGEADSYVWSSRPLSESAQGPMTLWYVAVRRAPDSATRRHLTGSVCAATPLRRSPRTASRCPGLRCSVTDGGGPGPGPDRRPAGLPDPQCRGAASA